MYAVTGASGNTGRVVAEKLLADREKVRVIGRDTSRLASLVHKGAEAFATDLIDAEGLARAFDGARAAYVLVPPNLASADVRAYQERVTDTLAAALEKAAVVYVVALS
ncbi:MAG TPA: NAD(P)H-binding protein, partial [Terriglobia bacterium]|nr:NAD(P)H-binding protein [Terriglobia bacterium]